MPELLDVKKTQKLLREYEFKKLFIEELGWNHYDEPFPVQIKEGDFLLKGIAEKAHLSVFIFDGEEFEGDFPPSSVRIKIETKVTKSFHEHIIIWIDRKNERQIWQWVKREKDQPIRRREHPYYAHQEGLDLIQRINNLAFSIEDEEKGISILDSAGRAKDAFDVEKVTKKFYDRFQKEHSVFMKFLNGIPDEEMERWYVSVMLNRLMFIYFIQKKGFLDENPNYLRDKLELFLDGDKGNYYRDFLCPLFFEGFAKNETERTDSINELLGKVPYLNGGLFLKHQIEEQFGEKIEIDNDAFRKIFEFFENYSWHLDVRKSAKGDEINPDVLGHIFEKYINQKQMGAYYTKEDITGYISKNTILPFLFDRAEEKCKIAFEGEKSVWNLLKQDPDRYIYEAVRKGTDLALPEEIEVGINTVSKRTEWNKTALEEYALPTEIWREVVARRKRYEDVKVKIENGELRSINDFITYNLDIRQFAQDVIETCEGPELLRAFWHAIVGRIPEKSNEKFEHGITVLDPTCGSGAFLFAALNILEPLYEACIDRMQIFIDEAEYATGNGTGKKYSDFRKVLESINKHPNRDYFIFKSIILNNLYGVDIMEEAVEICKLRLFLKLVAQIDDVAQIEPLPDIDFNIRAGNTLVGYVSEKDTKKGVAADLFAGKDANETMAEITEQLKDVDNLFKLFRKVQLENDPSSNDLKNTLKSKLSAVDDQLNRYLAGEYGIEVGDDHEYVKWLHSHKPFHWFVEFYGIMNKGGFDVIIGNPPYVEYTKIKKEFTIKDFKTIKCGNLYAFIYERCDEILINRGKISFIIPVSSISTKRMKEMQNLLLKGKSNVWLSHFSGDRNPAELFTGVKNRLTVLIAHKNIHKEPSIYVSDYLKWFSEARPYLFQKIEYEIVDHNPISFTIEKNGTLIAKEILQKINNHSNSISYYFLDQDSQHPIIYHNTPIHWTRSFSFMPYFWNERDGDVKSRQMVEKYVDSGIEQRIIVSIINSSLYYWYWVIHSDCYHMTLSDTERFKIDLKKITPDDKETVSNLCKKLMDDYEEKSNILEATYKTTGRVKYQQIDPKKSKHIINEIDNVLANAYDLTDEELDFIINYDIKYRMGKNNS